MNDGLFAGGGFGGGMISWFMMVHLGSSWSMTSFWEDIVVMDNLKHLFNAPE